MTQSTPNATHNQIAGDSAVLARRYIGALIELAEEQKQLDAVATDLIALRTIHQESQEFRYIAGHPRLTRGQLIQTVQALASTAKFSPLTTKFLSLLAQNRRLHEIGIMIDFFMDELASRRGEFTADIRSARALTASQQEQIAAKLQSLAGGKVHLSIREDASLLGGLTIKLGSRLIDASIKTKLARLERQLKTQTIPHKGAA